MVILKIGTAGIFKVLTLVVFFAVLMPVTACDREQELIRIGYVGGLTGRVAGLGIAGRDGALLAIEEINGQGGVNGRKVSLVVKDDHQDADIARKVVQELIQEDVMAIVGHMTSSMTAVTLPIINEAKKVMVSPTSKSDLFSGKDDYFFRVTAASSNNARKVADLAYNRMGLKKFAVIYDNNNTAFTGSWLTQFRQPLENFGGEIVVAREFHSGDANLSFLTLVKDILTDKPDAFLILANALDTALIAQQLHKLNVRVPMFASEWSFTSDVLNFGGVAVEGMISYHSFNSDSQRSQYLEYKKKFTKRFGYSPSFASVLSYDATSLILAALRKNPDVLQLKESLLGVGTFPGLQSDIKLDQYGDVTRELFQTVINNGQFRIID